MAEGKTQPAGEMLSISKLAERFDLDRATVRKYLAAAGVEPRKETKREKLYLLAEVEPYLSNPSDPLAAARLRKLEQESDLLDLKLRRERGELVSITEVGDEIQAVFKLLYQRVAVQYPREIAAQLYKAESPGQITDIMRHDMGRIFNEIREDYTSLFREDSRRDT
jgi:transcriptional regulator with XRE-family HTH domain